uniref:RUN domain-containing protein n=1 Tax=Timema genevievae TaxID=629358 RepID=A0A7R9K6N4_TIMGE|nr:unnamed protein product [Timema genevievae]
MSMVLLLAYHVVGSTTTATGAVEACLSQGLRRRALGLFKTSSTTALLHKVGKTYEPASVISRKIQEIENADPNRRSSSSGDSTNRLQTKPPLQKKNSTGTLPGPKYLWIRIALFEKQLAKIIDHLVQNSTVLHDSKICQARAFKRAGAYRPRTFLSESKSLQSKGLNKARAYCSWALKRIRAYQSLPYKGHQESKSLPSKGQPSREQEPTIQGQSRAYSPRAFKKARAFRPRALKRARAYHQEQDSDNPSLPNPSVHVLWIIPKQRHKIISGQILLLTNWFKDIASPVDTPLLHHVADQLLIFDAVYMLQAQRKGIDNYHCQQKIIRVSLPGERQVTRPPYRRATSHIQLFLYWDYAMNVRVDEVVYVHCHQQADSGGTIVLVGQDGVQQSPIHFPKGGHLLSFLSCLETGLLPHGQLDPPLWSQRGKVAGHELLDPSWTSHLQSRVRAHLVSTSTASSTSSSKSLSVDPSTGSGNDLPDSPCASPRQAASNHVVPKLTTGDSIQLVCDTMKRQIISRAFYGWLAYCRHLTTVRTHLSGLVNQNMVAIDDPKDASQGLSKSVWLELNDGGKINDKEEVFRLTYYGGVCHEIRKEVWPYLLGHYQFGSTHEERHELDLLTRQNYETTMSEWLAVEAIVRQRDKETMAANLAKLSSESTSGDVPPPTPALVQELSNDVFEDNVSLASDNDLDKDEIDYDRLKCNENQENKINYNGETEIIYDHNSCKKSKNTLTKDGDLEAENGDEGVKEEKSVIIMNGDHKDFSTFNGSEVSSAKVIDNYTNIEHTYENENMLTNRDIQETSGEVCKVNKSSSPDEGVDEDEDEDSENSREPNHIYNVQLLEKTVLECK